MWLLTVASSPPPGVRALTLLLILTATYVLYGYINFYRDPVSIFFSESHGFDTFYSATRQAEADAFLDDALRARARSSLSPSAGRKQVDHGDGDEEEDGDEQGSIILAAAAAAAAAAKAGPDPQICAVFLTIGREMQGRQYVETAMGSLLANMSAAERRAVHLALFFADVPDPEAQHASYEILESLNVADDIVTYQTLLAEDGLDEGQRKTKIESLEAWAAQKTDKFALERKAVHDYAYALRSCATRTSAPYIAVLEDDILLADGWAAQTLRHLQTVQRMMRAPTRLPSPSKGKVAPGEPPSWLYLRLFNQERSTGWGGGVGFRKNKVHLISLGVGIPLAALLLIIRRTKFLPRSAARQLDGWTVLIVCGVGLPLFVWLFFASGKASLLGNPAPGVYEEWFGCCNQALVYNRQHALALSDHLLNATQKEDRTGRADMLPRDYAWDQGLARLSAYPMLAQHAGRISATDTSRDEARRVWSMAFEDLRPEGLARDHGKNVKELFGAEAARDMLGVMKGAT